jgi:XTP/dITP diphosphohydrolase
MASDRRPDRRTILVATTNPGKVAELHALLGGDVDWVGLSAFPNAPKVEEDGETFSDNARKKATTYSRATGLWTLSDDSGLVVDALGGQPGVHSARFAGVTGPDRKTIDRSNIDKVRYLLRDIPADQRTARFVCHLCLASAEEVLIETFGALEGLIIDTPKGSNGFGYDPVFWVPSLGKTVAQMASDEKNALSHRGNAIAKFRPLLRDLVARTG